jgi:hypothetical protein
MSFLLKTVHALASLNVALTLASVSNTSPVDGPAPIFDSANIILQSRLVWVPVAEMDHKYQYISVGNFSSRLAYSTLRISS